MNTPGSQKRIAITGPSRGLRREIARACATRGNRLLLLARDRDALQSLSAELSAAHSNRNRWPNWSSP